MATLRKNSGHYYARFYDKNRSPKRKEVSLRTTRKDVAEPRLRKWEKACAEGRFDPWNGGWLAEHKSLTEAKRAFLKLKEQEGCRPHTLSAYEYALKGLQQHTPPGINVRDISADHIRPYVYESGKKNATHRHRYGHLNVFFRWCEEKSFLDSNPMGGVSQPRKEKKTPAYLKASDVDRIFTAIDEHRKDRMGKPGPTPHDQWVQEIVKVAVCTGLRRGELLNLKWEDIDLNSEILHVRNRDTEGFRTKSGSERTLPIVGDALETLSNMNSRRDPASTDIVFLDDRGEPVKPDRVSRRFKFYAEKADLADRITFHSCRHTTGTWLAMKGVPLRVIQGILGHAQASTTEVYTHLVDGMTERAMTETFGS
jgi:integrase